MGEDIISARTKLGSVLHRATPAFRNLVGKKLDKFLVEIDKTINNHLEEVGERIVDVIRKSIMASSSGRVYTYLDKDGNEIETHQSSIAMSAPNYFTGDLWESIEFKVNKGLQTVEVGVWNTSTGNQYATIAYYPRYYSTAEKRWIKDAVITGEGGMKTPIKDYARMLEEEQDRPFLRVNFYNTMLELNEEFRRDLRNNLSHLFEGKLPPVHFRFYAK